MDGEISHCVNVADKTRCQCFPASEIVEDVTSSTLLLLRPGLLGDRVELIPVELTPQEAPFAKTASMGVELIAIRVHGHLTLYQPHQQEHSQDAPAQQRTRNTAVLSLTVGKIAAPSTAPSSGVDVV